MAEFDGPDTRAEFLASAYQKHAKSPVHESGSSNQEPVPMSAILRLSLSSNGICGCRRPPYSSFIMQCW